MTVTTSYCNIIKTAQRALLSQSLLYLVCSICIFSSCEEHAQFENKVRPRTEQTQVRHYPKTSNGLDRNQQHLILTRHAKCRMACRHITEAELIEILHDGNINYKKSQLQDSRGPKYAVEGYSHNHQHLRIIFAPEQSATVVVTCIDLDNEWQCPSCN